MKCLVLTGSTGSGKTSLSLEIAEKFSCEILNCDSVQFFKGFDIGSAKPSQVERARVKHHGIDILDPTEAFDAGQFGLLAKRSCEEITKKGLLPLICGGSGLYLRSMLGDYFSHQMPERDEVLRQRIKNLTVDERWSLLRALDPVRAGEVNRNDFVRIERALELRILSGSPFSFWKKVSQEGQNLGGYCFYHIHIEVDPEVLRERLKVRTAIMISSGLVEECWRLWLKGVEMKKSPYNSIGYSQVFGFFSASETLCPHLGAAKSTSEFSEDESVRQHLKAIAKDRDLFDKIFYATCQYAKRQRTWFKKLKPDCVLKDAVLSDDLVLSIGEFKKK